VKLRSSTGGAEQYQLSDDSGAFSFRRLAGGSYTLNIDAGKDFEIVVETVDIVACTATRGLGNDCAGERHIKAQIESQSGQSRNH
jgi:hypothetical protein